MFMAILVFVNSRIFLLLLTRTMNFPGITFFYTSPKLSGVFFCFCFFWYPAGWETTRNSLRRVSKFKITPDYYLISSSSVNIEPSSTFTPDLRTETEANSVWTIQAWAVEVKHFQCTSWECKLETTVFTINTHAQKVIACVWTNNKHKEQDIYEKLGIQWVFAILPLWANLSTLWPQRLPTIWYTI